MINLVVCSLSALKCSEKSNKISEETIDLIARLNSEGIRFAVVTGMNYDAVSPLFGKIKKTLKYGNIVIECLSVSDKNL